MTGTSLHGPESVRAGSRRLSVWFFFSFVIVAFAIWSISSGRSEYAMVLLFGGVSGTAMLLGARRSSILSWAAAIPGYYLLFFVIIPLCESVLGIKELPDSGTLTRPLLWSCAGIVAFTLFNRFILTLIGRPHDPRHLFGDAFGVPPAIPGGFLGLLVLGLAGIVYSALFGYFGMNGELSEVGALAGIMGVASQLCGAALVIAWIESLSRGRRVWTLAAVVLLAGLIGIGLFSKSKSGVLMPVLLVAASLLLVKGKVPWRIALLTLVAYLFVVYPFVSAWRTVGTLSYGSRLEQFHEGLQVLSDARWLKSGMALGEAQASLGRGVLEVYCKIVNSTGEQTGFENGSTYAVAIAGFVPRLLWPDKPDATVGKTIGHKYGVVNPQDDATSIASTVLGEGYMNFGGFGVIVIMLLFGAAAVVVDYTMSRKMGRWFAVWALPVVIIGQEAAVASATSQFIKSTILLTLVISAVRSTRRRRRPRYAID